MFATTAPEYEQIEAAAEFVCLFVCFLHERFSLSRNCPVSLSVAPPSTLPHPHPHPSTCQSVRWPPLRGATPPEIKSMTTAASRQRECLCFMMSCCTSGWSESWSGPGRCRYRSPSSGPPNLARPAVMFCSTSSKGKTVKQEHTHTNQH